MTPYYIKSVHFENDTLIVEVRKNGDLSYRKTITLDANALTEVIKKMPNLI